MEVCGTNLMKGIKNRTVFAESVIWIIPGILVILWMYLIPIGPVGTQKITLAKHGEMCNNMRSMVCYKESSLSFLLYGLLVY
jgi:hypothetical protein